MSAADFRPVDLLTGGRAEAFKTIYAGRAVAFIASYHAHESPDGKERPGLGIAVANESGFYPVPLFYFAAGPSDFHLAEEKAEALNLEIFGLDTEESFQIVASTMGGRRYSPPVS